MSSASLEHAEVPGRPIFGDHSSTRSLKAFGQVGRCGVKTIGLLLGRRLHQPRNNVGAVVEFADGTSAAVYRETVIERPETREPVFLAVSFRLRLVTGPRAHALFRAESLLNTLLFAGFPGLVSKLWMRHDQHGAYRGLYEWDGLALALDYVNALWWVLALVSVPGSIRFVLAPGMRRDDVLSDPALLDHLPGGEEPWWHPIGWSRPPPAGSRGTSALARTG